MTEPLSQRISAQSHGADGDGSHDRSDGGSPNSRLRESRTVCSVFSDCENT